jgi:RNA polymerase sigma-70 factor (ECF subfamily)
MRQSISIQVPATDFASPDAAAGAPLPRMDEAAFHLFYQATAPALRGYIRRASGDAALADDVLQDAYYKFLRADLSPMEGSQRKAYLYRIANSLLSDHWRKLQRERRWSLERWLGRDTVENAAHSGAAMDVFQQLRPPERSLLWLAYVEGFTHREIATVMDLGEKSVRVLLFRARNKLAALLREQGFGLGEKT